MNDASPSQHSRESISDSTSTRINMSLDNENENRSRASNSSGSTGNNADSTAEATHKQRRASIQNIMTDPNLSNHQRRHAVQILMDGRRCSNFGQTFEEAARNVAVEFASLGTSNTASSTASASTVTNDTDGSILGDGYDGSNDQQYQRTRGSSTKRPLSSCSDTTPVNTLRTNAPTFSSSDNTTIAVTNTATNASSIITDETNAISQVEIMMNGSPYILNSEMIAYTLTGKPNGDPKLMEQNKPECTHYKRNCSIISPCCGIVYGCRLCHDECETQSIPFMNVLRENYQHLHQQIQHDNHSKEKGDTSSIIPSSRTSANVPNRNITNDTTTMAQQQQQQQNQFVGSSSQRQASFTRPTGTSTSAIASSSSGGTNISTGKNSIPSGSISRRISMDIHHDIDRFAISEIICRICYTRQSSKTNNCINCNIQFGEYHCSICNLWMENQEQPFHCSKCGICRVGGKENFIHCDECGMCIDKDVFPDHSCQAGKYMAKCPVCYEDLFSSRSPCHELPCNHSMHWHCFYELSQFDVRCPICKKTMLDVDDMRETWDELQEDIDVQPLPPDHARVVDIYCNDCEKHDSNRRWHPLGVSCLDCRGFNTSVDTKMVGIEAHNFLAQLERS